MPRLAEREPVQAPALEVAWESDLADHVVELAFSPDGLWLAAAAVGGPVTVYAVESGERKALLPGHHQGTLTLSWRADSQLLATGGQDGMVRVWDLAAGGSTCWAAGAQWVERVAYSEHSDYLACAAGRKLRLHNSQGDLLRGYPDHPSTISDIAWQPGELIFATSCYGQLATWHVNAEEPLKKFEWKGSVLCVAWSPDANFVATGNQDASVHFWYRKSGRDLEMTGYAHKVRELAWDADSRYLATGGSPVVIIWDCSAKGPAGSTPIQLAAHERSVSSLEFQPKGSLLASGGREGRVCLWTPKKSARPVRHSMLPGEVTKVRWQPSGRRLAAASSTGAIRVFKPAE
jgi:WD40 repeat protein